MAKLIDSKAVERVIRKHLESKGAVLSLAKKRGQTGPDIEARLGNLTYFVEVIGFQEKPPIRSREFYECFFRTISRDRDNPVHILLIGLPIRFKDGMKQRKRQYPIAWDKLGKVFPNLNLWYVDVEHNRIEQRSWSNPY